MQIIPAIDLLDGQCVRLLYGDYDQVTSYARDPVELAARYRDAGVTLLHLVNLDGAKGNQKESARNIDVMRQIVALEGLQVQTGGGIRTRNDIQQLFDAGVSRAVIGSLVIREPETVSAWMRDYGVERFTLALDVRLDATDSEGGAAGDAAQDGVTPDLATSNMPRIATHGWTEQTRTTLWQALAALETAPLHVLCTDISRDGAMRGPNLDLYRECLRQHPELLWQASGGLRDRGDVEALDAIGMPAAITGKALLENRLELAELGAYLGGVS